MRGSGATTGRSFFCVLALAAALAGPSPSADAAGSFRGRKVASPTRAALKTLVTGVLVKGETQDVGIGANKPRRVTLQGTDGTRVRAIFKPRSLEDPKLVAEMGGPLCVRETGAYALARALRLDLVPPTIERELEGELGSLQLYVEDPVEPDGALSIFTGQRAWASSFERSTSEKLRIFDYVLANTDRRADNLILRKVQGGLHTVAIDNGLSLPTGKLGAGRRITAFAPDDLGPFTADTRAWLAAIDLGHATRALAKSGVERSAIVLAIRRLARVRKDPSFLELQRNYQQFMHTIDRMNRLIRQDDQGLEADELTKIDALVDRALRGRR